MARHLLLCFTSFLASLLLLSTAFACPNNCTGHGSCQPASALCQCDPMWLDADCSTAAGMSPVTVGDEASFSFYWRVLDGSTLLMRINASTDLRDEVTTDALDHGWAAVMLGASHGMVDGRLVRVGWNTTTNMPMATNMYSATFEEPSLTKSTVYNVTGFVTSLGIDVSFATPLEPLLGEKYGVSSIVPLSWAWSTTLVPMRPHMDGTHGMLRVNLAAQSVIASQSLDFYIPAYVAIGIACLLSVLMQVVPVKYSSLGQCCLHRRVPSVRSCCSRRKWRRGAQRIPSEEVNDHLVTPTTSATILSSCSRLVSLLTFDLVHTVLSWSLGEVVLVSLYTAALVAFIAQGVRSYVDYSLDPILLLGQLTAWHLALTLLPVTRQSLFLVIFAMPYERAVAYHRYCSRVAFLFICLHGLTMTREYGTGSLLQTDDLPHGDGVVWGFLTFLCVLLMVLTSLSFVRRRLYELFYYVHIALFLPAVTFAAKHSTYFRYMLIVPLALVVVDYFRGLRRTYNAVQVTRMRLVQGEQDRALLITARVKGMTELRVGGYVMLNAPTVSLWQWHPYSVCGLRRDAEGVELDVCLLDTGAQSWSGRLCEDVDLLRHVRPEDGAEVTVRREAATHRVKKTSQERKERAVEATTDDEDGDDVSPDSAHSPPGSAHSRPTSSSAPHALIITPSSSSAALLELNLYGPCGRLSFSVADYHTLVLIAGGVGITPCAQVIQHVLYSPGPGPRLYLIWASRNRTFFTHLFPSLLRRMRASKRCHVLLFDTRRAARPGHVARKRRLRLSDGDGNDDLPRLDGALESSSVDVFDGRPNVARLLDWVEREHEAATEGDAAAGADGSDAKRRGDVEMVIRTQGADGWDDVALGDEEGNEEELTLDDIDDDDAASNDSTYSVSVPASRAANGAVVEPRRSIGCIACGPMALLDDVESACNARAIDLHREIFEL